MAVQAARTMTVPSPLQADVVSSWTITQETGFLSVSLPLLAVLMSPQALIGFVVQLAETLNTQRLKVKPQGYHVPFADVYQSDVSHASIPHKMDFSGCSQSPSSQRGRANAGASASAACADSSSLQECNAGDFVLPGDV